MRRWKRKRLTCNVLRPFSLPPISEIRQLGCRISSYQWSHNLRGASVFIHMVTLPEFQCDVIGPVDKTSSEKKKKLPSEHVFSSIERNQGVCVVASSPPPAPHPLLLLNLSAQSVSGSCLLPNSCFVFGCLAGILGAKTNSVVKDSRRRWWRWSWWKSYGQTPWTDVYQLWSL